MAGYYACGAFIANLQQIYGPWLSSEFHFSSITCEQIYGILSNFAHPFTLTTSRLGLLRFHFHKFTTKVCHSIVSAQYLVNKLMDFDQILYML